jgi:hypothetical protein
VNLYDDLDDEALVLVTTDVGNTLEEGGYVEEK